MKKVMVIIRRVL